MAFSTIPHIPAASERLKSKVAIVTGAGTRGDLPGTGQASAILLAAHGAKVLLADNDRDRTQKTAETIHTLGGEASIFIGDITSRDDCRAMVEKCQERYGGLHILVNNVGVHGPGMVTEFDEERWNRALDVNLKSTVLACGVAVPAMAASGGGSIINISSIDGIRAGATRNIPYAVAKGGVIALTTHMAVHHGRQNIRVNAIAPGHIYGSFVSQITPEMRELRKKVGPLGSEGTAWDVAWAVVFLASDEARWISGVVLPVDAGLFAATPLSILENLLESTEQ
jgi:NAD(P)-dependent dehydrogenase (short-subunit alcohol dehydrogenase family)